MSSAALVLLTLAATTPELSTLVEEKPFFYVDVPDLDRLVGELQRSPFRNLLGMFVTPKERAQLAKSPEARLLAAGYPGRLVVLADAGSAAPSLKTSVVRTLGELGFRAQQSGKNGSLELRSKGYESLFLLHEGQRLLLTNSEGHVARGFAPARTPLALSRPSGPVLTGRVNVSRIYGQLAQRNDARVYAGNLQRLGLMPLSAVDVEGRVDGNRLRSKVTLDLAGEPEGVWAVLEPRGVELDGNRLPKDLLGATVIALRPAALFQLALKLLAYNAPIQYGLLKAQQMGIEDKLQKRIDLDILGEQAGLLYHLQLRQGHVWVLTLRDPVAGAALLSRVVDSVRVMAPEVRAKTRKVGKHTLWELGRGGQNAWAATPLGVVVGEPKAVAAFLVKPKAWLPSTQPRPGQLAVSLLSPEALRANSQSLGVKLPKRALGLTRLSLTRTGGGYTLESETRAP